MLLFVITCVILINNTIGYTILQEKVPPKPMSYAYNESYCICIDNIDSKLIHNYDSAFNIVKNTFYRISEHIINPKYINTNNNNNTTNLFEDINFNNGDFKILLSTLNTSFATMNNTFHILYNDLESIAMDTDFNKLMTIITGYTLKKELYQLFDKFISL